MLKFQIPQLHLQPGSSVLPTEITPPPGTTSGLVMVNRSRLGESMCETLEIAVDRSEDGGQIWHRLASEQFFPKLHTVETEGNWLVGTGVSDLTPATEDTRLRIRFEVSGDQVIIGPGFAFIGLDEE